MSRPKGGIPIEWEGHLDWNSRSLRGLQAKLLDWGEQIPRRMPWRGIGDPYRVWISEIMLQQTTVTAVIPYYERFVNRFPDVRSLADARVEEVLSLWEGLGYYSRGRNLHKAAGVVANQLQGQFPETVPELMELPGVGRYTAGAIASFGHGQKAPILEANTLRLYSRLMGFEHDPRSSAGQALLWLFADRILPSSRFGDFNQALIDLGATVCTPVAPACDQCPLMKECRAFQNGKQAVIPQAKPRPEVTRLAEVAVAIRKQDKWLVRQRQPGERWEGMWDFWRMDPGSELVPTASLDGVLAACEQGTGVHAKFMARLSDAPYTVTRFRVTLSRIVCEYVEGMWTGTGPGEWKTLEELAALPMPIAARAFLTELQQGGWDPGEPFQLTGQVKKHQSLRTKAGRKRAGHE